MRKFVTMLSLFVVACLASAFAFAGDFTVASKQANATYAKAMNDCAKKDTLAAVKVCKSEATATHKRVVAKAEAAYKKSVEESDADYKKAVDEATATKVKADDKAK